METLLLSREELARRAKALYEKTIRRQVETEENIGKMVIIDIESGDFAVDDLGIESSHQLRAKNPNARLYGIRIGYNVAASLGGVMERTTPLPPVKENAPQSINVLGTSEQGLLTSWRNG